VRNSESAGIFIFFIVQPALALIGLVVGVYGLFGMMAGL